MTPSGSRDASESSFRRPHTSTTSPSERYSTCSRLFTAAAHLQMVSWRRWDSKTRQTRRSRSSPAVSSNASPSQLRLVNDPELIFLDEPTAGLDPKGRRDLWDFIQTANRQGRTVVITTHFMDEAEFLCDRVAIMDRGKIVALATPSDLVQSLPAPYRISVGLDNGRGTDGLESLACVSEMLRDRDGNAVLHSSDSAATIPALMEWVSS